MRRTWLWILLALFALLCVCSVAVVGLVGGLVGLGIVVQAPVEVAVDPPVFRVEQGEEAVLTLRLTNTADEPVQVASLTVPRAWLEGAHLLRSEPPFVASTEESDGLVLAFENLSIPPGQQARIRLVFEGRTPGRYSGDWTVSLEDTRLSTFSSTVVVEERTAAVEVATETPPPSPTPVPTPTPTSTPTPPESGDLAALVERLARSVVMIVALENGEPVWSGSGTIIDPRGYILTNAHVVLDDYGQPAEDLLVLVTEAPEQPPVPRYRARVVQADPRLDLAVIKIDRDVEGRPITDLDLPAVPLGDSDRLRLGESLLILGYPGIGGDTITFTQGEVGGFIEQPGYGPRAWIKTSATIAGGSSGGLAANRQGELVGIPTLLGAGESSEVVDCRPLVDTNGDGMVDEQDTCVPIGGYINSLRPVNLAKPLIQAALTGKVALPTPHPQMEGSKYALEEVFYEPFNNAATGYWLEEETAAAATHYKNGRFIVHLQKPEYVVWFSFKERALADMAVGVTAEVLWPTGTGEVGVICRESPGFGFYAFSVSEDGYYSIWMRYKDEFDVLIPWKRLPQPVLKKGRPVRISAICYGTSLGLLVNDEIIDEVEDDRIAVGYGGFVLGTWDEPGFRVAFDDFVVYQVKAQE